jgi:uncharacterized protein YqjF (DUF2071 family)
MLGPVLYGLPYRFGDLRYDHNPSNPYLVGEVRAQHDLLHYRAILPAAPRYGPSQPQSFSHFLLERYIAFTKHGPFRRLFHVWHEPWPQTPITVQFESDNLLHQTGRWFAHANFDSANFSPGLASVKMGWPQSLQPR